jgi:FtsK/SpoIIIE family
MTRMMRWTAGRRALVVALVVTLTVLWQWASWSGDRGLSILYVVSALAYVAGAVAGTVLLSRWIWRHRALVIVRSLVTQRYRTGPGGLWRRYVVPKLWSHAREGDIQHYWFTMPVGVTLTVLNRWREVLEQALDRGVDWQYERGLYHMRVIAGWVPDRVTFAELLSQARPAGELVFAVGMGRLGPVWADLAALPHLLIGGWTGAGKSVFVRQLVAWLVLLNRPERLRVGFIDLKGGMELNLFARLPHRLGPVLREWQECGSLLEYLNGELDARQAAFDRAGVVSLAEWNGRHPGSALPYLVLVVDEMAELTAVDSSDKAERATRQALLGLLVRLCRLGRAAGIHIICATQRPDADAVPGQLKANLPATMALRVRDPVNSRVLLGDGNPQAASLPVIPGRGIWQSDVQVELQTPLLERSEAAGLLVQAYPEAAGVRLEPAGRSER